MIDQPPSLQDQWFMAVGAVVACARFVTVFDGTDRHSLDGLRDALFALGLIEEEIQRLMGTNEA